jgi:hypothetical protein
MEQRSSVVGVTSGDSLRINNLSMDWLKILAWSAALFGAASFWLLLGAALYKLVGHHG